MAVIEFARNVLGLKGANSIEFDENTKNPVIHLIENKKEFYKKDGTMRLGAYDCLLKSDTVVSKLYDVEKISERHRHRYEYNKAYKEMLEKEGLICSGISPDGTFVEIIELKEHPYFIGSQFHPEYKSRPNAPAPLFVGLIEAAKETI